MAEEYVAQPHRIKPHGIFGGEDFKIKKYSMVPIIGGKRFSDDEVKSAYDLIGREVLQGKIDRRLGFGFGILSDGILNVCVWGGQFPSLLNQAVYSFDRSRLVTPSKQITRQSLDETGTFCCWEIGVVSHEAAAWRRYLLSEQVPKDKKGYLDDFFEGVVI